MLSLLNLTSLLLLALVCH